MSWAALPMIFYTVYGKVNGMRSYFLATELRQYYTREKNKVLFKGDYSLNELALMIGDKTHDSFDASALSKVLSGKRLFTHVQLSACSCLLRLSKKEKDMLERSLAKDLLFRHSHSINVLKRKSLYTKLLEFVMTKQARYVHDEDVEYVVTDREHKMLQQFFTELSNRLHDDRKSDMVSWDPYVVLCRYTRHGERYNLFSPKVFLRPCLK